jgi:hypothetical protein
LEAPVKHSFITVVYLASGAGAVERCATALLARAVGVHGLERRGEGDGVVDSYEKRTELGVLITWYQSLSL